MLKVRLQRTGKRGQAYFRVVVLEHTKKPRGKFLELLGNYDPHKKELKVDMERLNHWVSNGAQTSPTVNNLLVNYKYWDKPKMQSWKPKNKPASAVGRTESASDETKSAESSSRTSPEALSTAREVKPASAESFGEVKQETAPAEEPKPEETPAEQKLSEEPKPETAPTEQPKPEEAPVS